VLTDEPFGGTDVGGSEYVGADRPYYFGSSIVDVDRVVPGDAAVVVLGVVPAEEPLAERAGVFDAAEAVGEVGPVLQRPEVRLAVGIVVALTG
jgi:hypothetical protein